MEFKYAPIRSLNQPHLQVREEMKIIADKVGLYDRNVRLTEYDEGQLGLSNFSLYWFTPEVMIGFYCDQISNIELTPKLFSRHAKIKIYFNESLLQLSFRGTDNTKIFFDTLQQVLNKKEWLNMGGIHHLINKKHNDLQEKKQLVNDAFSSLDNILAKMNQLMDLAKTKNHLLPDLQVSQDINETVYNIIQILLKKNQMITTLQLFYLVNKSNQYHSISPKELLAILTNLQQEQKIVFRELNGNAIIQSLDFDDEMFLSKLISLFDQYPALSVQLISTEFQIPFQTCNVMMEWICENKTMIAKDDCLHGTLYYKNII